MSPSERARRRTRHLVWFCAVVVVLSFGLSAWTFVRQSQAEAVRTADEKARAVAQVESCRQQVENGPRVVKILELVDLLATNSIIVNRQALARGGDNLAGVRRESLTRLLPAREQLRSFIADTSRRTPTVYQCRRLAEELGVH